MWRGIRAGILKVIKNSDYRDELIKSGFENIERFQSERIAQQYCNIYQEILNKQKKN